MQIFTYFMIAIIAILGTAALVYYTKLEAMKEQYELMKEQYEIRLAELKEKSNSWIEVIGNDDLYFF